MNYEDLRYHIDHHVALRFIRKDHAPLIGSFLHQAFKTDNHLKLLETELTDRLYDFLNALNLGHAPAFYPLSPKEYLKQWTQSGFSAQSLRRRLGYSDVSTYCGQRAGPAMAGRARQEGVVGTESRLLQIIRLLKIWYRKPSRTPPSALSYWKSRRNS